MVSVIAGVFFSIILLDIPALLLICLVVLSGTGDPELIWLKLFSHLHNALTLFIFSSGG